MMTLVVLVLLLGLQMASAMCPERCKCDDVKFTAVCIKAGLEVMPNTLNPRLKTIIYKYNNFPTVDVSLRFLTRLETVDLSHNQIISISSTAFGRSRNLKVLKLDGNKISHISKEIFKGLQNTEVMSLRSNEIAELPDKVFKNAPKLQKLHLGRNRIRTVNQAAFHGLQDLKILHLSENFLTSVPMEALKPLESLAELHLSGNPLKTLPENAFVHFFGLHSLDLTSCRLTQLHNLAFNGLGTLRHLKLGDNNLSEVPTEALRRVPNLHSLHLGRNPFELIGPQAFSPLSQLRQVEISGCNQLGSIEANAFQGCLDLKHAVLSQNRALMYLDPQMFDSGLNTLTSLDLADNGLQNLPSNLVPWSKLHNLDLSNNPWHCNCDLHFVSDMLAQFKSKNISDNNNEIIPGQCASPEPMRGLTLNNLKTDMGFCNTNQHTDSMVEVDDTKENSDLRRSNEVRNAYQERHEATNSIAVIVSVSIVSVVIFLTILTFIYLKFCRHRVQDCIKDYKWRNHEAALARKTTLSQPYLNGDNYIYTSPRLHHTYVYHGVQQQQQQHTNTVQHQQHHSPLVNYPSIYRVTNNELANTTDAEDEYFYVSSYGSASGGVPNTYGAPGTSNSIVMANGTVGKSIPVTVL